MCGIIGYVGSQAAVPILLGGLKRLEYRGYDSAGVAVVNGNGSLEVRRAAGKLVNLENEVREHPLAGNYGIGHTRWATHGRPTEENAHPHLDCAGQIVVVHNGIIENYLDLRQQLSESGHQFVTETDTEAIVHLIEAHYDGDLEAAVRASLAELEGIYALAVITAEEPQKIVAARLGPPIVVGLGEQEQFIASDIPPILEHTRNVVFLDDRQLAVLTPAGAALSTLEGETLEIEPQRITWDPITAEKGGYKHFMLKEIHQQPEAVRDSLVGRMQRASSTVELPELGLDRDLGNNIRKLFLLGCGTSWYASLVGKYWIEGLAHLPVETDYGSEFRYRKPLIPEGSVACSITQSGETADTLAAMREARERGAQLWTICNVVGSMAARLAEGVLYTQAGPEIGVASTKAFTSQLTCLYLLALRLAELRDLLDPESMAERLTALAQVPGHIESILSREPEIAAISRRLSDFAHFIYLGRGPLYPIALEGALKLKEISYIHAHGYPAGEMKHGPIALIDHQVPVVSLSPVGPWYEKVCSNMQEAKARDGFMVCVASEGDDRIVELADEVLWIPQCHPELTPLLAVIPLQMLAYHIAVQRGCDVDQPRNLAKSVTVE